MASEQVVYVSFFHFTSLFLGDCRRFPPRIIVLSDYQIESVFPQTDIGDFCGEWKPILDSGSISVYDDE